MEYIAAIEKALGIKAIYNMMPMQAGDVPSTHADVSRLEKELGYQSKVGVEEGVSKFVAWYREFYSAP